MLIYSKHSKFQYVLQVNVVDTVGCGDSFGAAIAFGYIHSLPLLHTLALANAVGGATAMSSGAGRAVATLAKVIELMTGSQINEDDNFINKLLHTDFNVLEITIISNMIDNRKIKKLNHVPLQKVVSELLLIFDSGRLKHNVNVG